MPAKKKIDSIDNKAERIINEYNYNLAVPQQLFLEENVGSKDLLKLARDCFQDQLLDEHSEEFNKVKNYLVKVKRGRQAHNFSDEEIEFITQNGPLMRPMDIARGLFPDSAGPLAKESQTIAQLCKALEIEFDDPDKNNGAVTGDYEPPRTVGKIIELINKADSNAKFHITQMNLDPRKKECVVNLKRNMNSPRFVMTANTFRTKKLREFFEIEFARAAYDKPDLITDEANQYISLCKAYAEEIIVAETIGNLNDRLNEVSMDQDNGGKLHMSLVEALETKMQEAKGLRDYIARTQKTLSGSRADRIDKLASLNDSLARFVQLAQEKKGREQYQRTQEAQNIEVEAELKKIKTHSDLIAEMYGIQIQEILNF